MGTGGPGEVYIGCRMCADRSLGAGLARPEGEGREYEILNRKMAVERMDIIYGSGT